MPETRERRWNKAFGYLLAYVEAEGHARVPQSHRTADGYPLGRWVAHQRTKKDSLSADRRERLDGVDGWVWDGVAAAWDEGFGHLLAYVEAEGHALVPQIHRTDDGYLLGSWVSHQRSGKDTLSEERRQRLDEVGFVWDAQDYAAAWEEGFGHILAYVKADGHALVPKGYRTADGYTLGTWCNTQRRSKRDGTLSPERLQRLDAVGFIWYAKLRHVAIQAILGNYRQMKGNDSD
jgi:hypothetical protein